MEKFKINKENEKMSSINRTIRLKPDIFERLTLLSEKNEISFNKLVNQCIEYALNNLDDENL